MFSLVLFFLVEILSHYFFPAWPQVPEIKWSLLFSILSNWDYRCGLSWFWLQWGPNRHFVIVKNICYTIGCVRKWSEPGATISQKNFLLLYIKHLAQEYGRHHICICCSFYYFFSFILLDYQNNNSNNTQ